MIPNIPAGTYRREMFSLPYVGCKAEASASDLAMPPHGVTHLAKKAY